MTADPKQNWELGRELANERGSTVKKGDRIVMVYPAPAPDPIRAGTRGTIEGTETGVGVKWDNRRTPTTLSPDDVVRVLEGDERKLDEIRQIALDHCDYDTPILHRILHIIEGMI